MHFKSKLLEIGKNVFHFELCVNKVGLWKYHARPGPISFRTFKLKISIYLSLGKCKCIKLKVSNGAKIRNRYNQVPHLTQDKLYNSIFHIMINYYELTSCIENSGDPDQLASSGAS